MLATCALLTLGGCRTAHFLPLREVQSLMQTAADIALAHGIVLREQIWNHDELP